MLEAFLDYPYGFEEQQFTDWSRSYYSQEAHVDSILMMRSDTVFHKPTDESMIEVDQYCNEYFSNLPKVESLDFKKDLDKVPFESSSSAGYLYPGKKGDGDNHQRAINQAYAIIKDCLRGNLQHQIDESVPDMAFTRTQLTKLTEKLKVRNVFGQHFAYILLEGLTASPLMDMFTTNDTFFFIGKDPRIHVPYLLEEAKRRGPRLLTTDWSGFDTSAEPWEISDAFDLLHSILEFPNEESEAAFEFSRILFINRKIASPDGTVYFKERSVPSGSYFTMLIDSIINWRRILYLHHRATGRFPIDIWTQGDDGLIITFKDVYPESLSVQIPAASTWNLNPWKCDFGESGALVQFLQRRLKWGDQARDVEKVERLAIFPEYEVTSGQISAYRAFALWQDCNYESHVLGHAYVYLSKKYGFPDDIPNKYKLYWQVVFADDKH
jgi:hypothetical protein